MLDAPDRRPAPAKRPVPPRAKSDAPSALGFIEPSGRSICLVSSGMSRSIRLALSVPKSRWMPPLTGADDDGAAVGHQADHPRIRNLLRLGRRHDAPPFFAVLCHLPAAGFGDSAGLGPVIDRPYEPRGAAEFRVGDIDQHLRQKGRGEPVVAKHDFTLPLDQIADHAFGFGPHDSERIHLVGFAGRALQKRQEAITRDCWMSSPRSKLLAPSVERDCRCFELKRTSREFHISRRTPQFPGNETPMKINEIMTNAVNRVTPDPEINAAAQR